jgi:hypothetical protein
VISEIDIWRAPALMMKRFGDDAPIESGKRADELAIAGGDDAGAAIWRRIEDAAEKRQHDPSWAGALNPAAGAPKGL